MISSEKLFAQTFHSGTNRFGIVSSFRRVAQLGLPAATPLVYQEWLDFAQLLFHDPEYDKMFTDKQKVIEITGGVEGIGAKMAEDQIDWFRATVDAASLVFSHSVLDSVALDYCRVTAIHSPKDWVKYIGQKKINISDMVGRSYDEIVWEKIDELIDSYDRESLLFKIDRLFQICRPGRDFDPIHDYKFDHDRLVALDKMRHDIVHGSGPIMTLPRGDEDIWFIQQTAGYLMALVNMRFNIKINPQDLMPDPKN
jgi:hypothetical protein